MKKLNLIFFLFGIACMIIGSLQVIGLLILDSNNFLKIDDIFIGIMLIFGIGIILLLIARWINRN